jgi:multidrug transporter EmrE-like cation transporter
MNPVSTVLSVLLLTAIELTAQTSLNHFHLLRSSRDKERLWFLPYLASALYASIAFVLLNSYRYSSMARIEVYWDAATTIIVPLAAMILFRSDINGYGWLGIAMTVAGALILAFSGDM